MLFGIEDLHSIRQARIRCQCVAPDAYRDFSWGFSWARVGEKYHVPKHLIMTACKQYAEDVALAWPPRDATRGGRPAKEKPPKAPKLKSMKDIEAEQLEKIKPQMPEVYKLYCELCNIRQVSERISFTYKVTRLALETYAADNQLLYPVTKQLKKAQEAEAFRQIRTDKKHPLSLFGYYASRRSLDIHDPEYAFDYREWYDYTKSQGGEGSVA